jgi:CRISPR type I-E-associated protein CasB/Cse2
MEQIETIPFESDVHVQAHKFVSKLTSSQDRSKKDIAMISSLRHGRQFVPGTDPQMHRYVLPYIRDNATEWEAQTFYMVGTLFALHPSDTKDKINFGTSYHRVSVVTGHNVEKKFLTILASPREDLFSKLLSAVTHLRTASVPLNWTRLLIDLNYWGKRVQLNWGKGYYRNVM